MYFFEILPEKVINLPTINSLGYSDVNNAYGPMIRTEYIVHYVVAGKGYFDGKPMEAGQGFLILPGEEHEYHFDKNEPWAYIWFKSLDKNIKAFFDLHGAVDGVFSYHNRDELLSVIEQLKPLGNKIKTTSRLGELFLHIFNSCILNDNTDGRLNSNYYCDYCKRYIDLHIDMPVSVSTLCDMLGITQPYLYKIFMKEFGISPKRYIIQRKIKKAKNMLLETDASISVIATSVGFADTISFSKFFKSSVGTSPSAFRSKKDI